LLTTQIIFAIKGQIACLFISDSSGKPLRLKPITQDFALDTSTYLRSVLSLVPLSNDYIAIKNEAYSTFHTQRSHGTA